MTSTFYIDLHTNHIHVYQYGSGKRVLIFFHGFGESGEEYGILGDLLGEEYTIIIPDLPFHGKTEWGNKPLTVELLLEFVQLILKQKGANSCALLGYSMGGRLATCLMQYAPSAIDRLLLVAPEGLRKNPWFQFATGTLTGQWLFKKITFHPQWVTLLIKTGKKAGWIGKKRAVYVRDLMADRSNRLRVYHCWQCFQKLHPQTDYYPFKNNAFPVHLYFGKYDRLIPAPTEKEMQNWAPAKISIFSTGHLLFLHEPMLKEIYTYLCLPAKHK